MSTRENFKEKIDVVVEDFVKNLKLKLSKRLECLGIIGGYARREVAESWPDINFFIVFRDRATAEDWLTLGEILNRTAETYKEEFRIKVEFRPVRYLYPKGEAKDDLYFGLSVFDGADKYRKPPFGVSELFLSGARSSMRVLFGSNVLADLSLELNEESLRTAMIETLLFRTHLVRIPCQYNLEKETSLFMSESMSIGKSILYMGVEAALELDALRRGEHIPIIEKKEALREFYKKTYGTEIADYAQTILETREQLLEWKNDEKRATQLFNAAVNLANAVFFKFASRGL